MFISESEDELEQLHLDSDPESENSCVDEDYIPSGLTRGSDQWVTTHTLRAGYRSKKCPRQN